MFRFTLPSNEQADTIYIAEAPDTTPAGEFFTENVVDLGVLSGDVREWAPESPLYAGAYWWNVESHDRDSFESYYSAPSAFTVAASARVLGIATERLPFIHVLYLKVRWQTNAKTGRVGVSIYRGDRRVWSASRPEQTFQGEPGESLFRWARPRRIKGGARLRIVATLRAGDATARRSRAVRTP